MPDRPPPIRTTVVRTERLTPHLVRVVVAAPDVTPYAESSYTDRYVKLVFDHEGRTVFRTYTIRAVDPERRELTIDFVTHGDAGIAAPWAAGARAGDALHMTAPGGAYAPSPDVDHHVLVGDAAALPAIASSLEDMPAGARATVLVQVHGPDDEIPLPTPADTTVTWLHSDDPDALVAAVRALDRPGGRVQLFVHGELRAVRAIRRDLAERGLDLDPALLSLSGYWRRGKDEDGFQAEKRELAAADRAAAPRAHQVPGTS